MHSLRYFTLPILLLTLCSSFNVWAQTAIDTTDPASPVFVKRHYLQQSNPDRIKSDYAIERANRPQPKLGIALAGGGTRAALFAHGVLQGLNDSRVLEHVDAISSVSGGSYAAYWYFSKQLEARRMGFGPEEIFKDCLPTWWVEGSKPTKDFTDQTLHILMNKAAQAQPQIMAPCTNSLHWEPGDPYRWQAHLARWPDVFRHYPGYVDGNWQHAPIAWTVSELPALTIEAFLKIIPVKSLLPREYHYGIERVWGLSPAPRQFDAAPLTIRQDKLTRWTYTNGKGELGQGDMHVNPDAAGWKTLADTYKADPTLPLWVLNATQGQKKRIPNPDHIYEMTPLSHGSRALGYRNESPQAAGIPDLGTGTLASAAFADRQGWNGPASWFFNLHKALTWGIDIENRFGPVPAELHLSDGGGSENLGLYSLIKRGIPDIIVVDEAQDMEGMMDDLCWARQALSQDGLRLSFDKLGNFEQLCESWEPDSKLGKKAYNTSAWLNPVVTGTVTWPEVDGKKVPPTRIWLIKLGWNQQAFRRAFNAQDCQSKAHPVNCLLTVYYGHNTQTINKKDGYMIFPHLSTAGSTYNSSSYLFWAYRELGRMVASTLVWDETNGGQLALAAGTVEQQQKMCDYLPNRRPQRIPGSPEADLACK